MLTISQIVDIHSHIWPASYGALLRWRDAPPFIDTNANTSVNRPGVARKPLLPVLYDAAARIQFIDKQEIDISVVSLRNPWLDFVATEDERAEAGQVFLSINSEMKDMCCNEEGCLYYFAVLIRCTPSHCLQWTPFLISRLCHRSRTAGM
jgi:aminocarboxymuconate-semialdehyde decarboxylase